MMNQASADAASNNTDKKNIGGEEPANIDTGSKAGPSRAGSVNTRQLLPVASKRARSVVSLGHEDLDLAVLGPGLFVRTHGVQLTS